MKNTLQAKWFPVLAGVGLVTQSAGAAAPVPTLIYDNAQNPLNAYFATQTEVGDEISTLVPNAWIAYADTFTFEYFASGLSGGETAKIRFYANDGALAAGSVSQKPLTMFYESPAFNLINGNIPVTITDLKGLDIRLPQTFTWTVTPTGVTGNEIFGLKLYDPPVIGESLNDVWQLVGNDWVLKQIDGKVANFGAQLLAVPEPSALTLLGLGGVALLLRRRSASR